MNLPWWVWAILAVGAIGLVLFFTSWRHYRTQVREKFLAYFEAEHPEVEVTGVTPGAVNVRTQGGGEGSLNLIRLY